MEGTSLNRLSDELLHWFDENRRSLPWRSSRHPYPVWISEIMLQQTQVDRVVPYFESFLRRFPRVEALAAAPLDDVLAAWSGLGYYRRARHLHAAARQIVARGDFPREIGDWRALPGVGPYTAAAITSIAFGTKTPVLDANVERVLSRCVGLEEDPKRASGGRRLLETAESLLDDDRPGDSNQALMELGATICTPRAPACSGCPLSPECAALRTGAQELFPMRSSEKRAKTVEHRLAVVVERRGKVLLFRRPESSTVLAGLWELPWVPRSGPELAEAELETRYGGTWRLDQRLGSVRHAITFRDIRLEVWRGRVRSSRRLAEGAEAGWFSAELLAEIPLSTLVTKVLRRADGR